MKTRFSRARSFVPDWNGNKQLPAADQLKFTLKPMEVGDLYDLQDIVGRLGLKVVEEGETKTIDTKELKPEVQRQFVVTAKDYIPKYAVFANGPLLADDGTEISLLEVGNTDFFLGLASEILWTLLQNATPAGADSKN